MPTQITQTENGPENILRVEGDLLYDDAIILERVAGQILEDTDGNVVIDLSDIDFLDSESASVLRRLQNNARTRIEGIEFFVQSAIDSVERTN